MWSMPTALPGVTHMSPRRSYFDEVPSRCSPGFRASKQPFDRVIVRLSPTAADEAHYVNALGDSDRCSRGQVGHCRLLGTGHARLYATTAIPTGLSSRFGDAHHSGVLTLNFGVLSRLTWLDADGHEGFLGLGAGIMAIRVGQRHRRYRPILTQVGAVSGLGISVPIANRASPTQASINLHGWFEREHPRARAPIPVGATRIYIWSEHLDRERWHQFVTREPLRVGVNARRCCEALRLTDRPLVAAQRCVITGSWGESNGHDRVISTRRRCR